MGFKNFIQKKNWFHLRPLLRFDWSRERTRSTFTSGPTLLGDRGSRDDQVVVPVVSPVGEMTRTGTRRERLNRRRNPSFHRPRTQGRTEGASDSTRPSSSTVSRVVSSHKTFTNLLGETTVPSSRGSLLWTNAEYSPEVHVMATVVRISLRTRGM